MVFELHVTTQTKTLKRKDYPDPDDESGKPLFSSPPSSFAGAKLKLDRKVTIRAGADEEDYTPKASLCMGGLGADAPTELKEKVGVDTSAPEWIPPPTHEKREAESVHGDGPLFLPG